MDKIQIRKSKPQDWNTVWGWMRALDWVNIGHDTGFLGYKLRHIHQMVAVDENDEPVSYISFYIKNDFANVNVYITDRNYRGLGIGSSLWTRMMEELKDVPNIGIGSGGKMTTKYNEIHGFHILSPVKLCRFAGFLSYHNLQPYLNEGYYDSGAEIFSVQNDKDIEKIVHFDRQVVGFDRGEFLWPWIRWGRVTAHQPNPIVMTMCAVDQASGDVLGYGSLSPAMEWYKIGPLYAKDDQTAYHLIYELLKSYTTNVKMFDHVIINTPSINASMVKLLNDLELENIFELDLSYTTMLPEIYYKYVYSATSHVCQID